MNLITCIIKYNSWKNAPVVNELKAIRSEICSVTDRRSIQSVVLPDESEYIGRNADKTIIPYMRKEQRLWGGKDLELFFDTIKNYCCCDVGGGKKADGIFLDIGANIGTSCIYALKKEPLLRAIAFEPDPDNYKMLKCNCILSELEDKITCVKTALSNKNGEQKFSYCASNPGGSRLRSDDVPDPNFKTVPVCTLDSYIEKSGINPSDIRMIWIDTEGFEAEVVAGGIETLKKADAPMFTEININEYVQKGVLDGFIRNMQGLYSYFIDVHRIFGIKVMQTDRLRNYIKLLERKGSPQTDFIFFNKR